jgi:hypothetical protein
MRDMQRQSCVTMIASKQSTGEQRRNNENQMHAHTRLGRNHTSQAIGRFRMLTSDPPAAWQICSTWRVRNIHPARASERTRCETTLADRCSSFPSLQRLLVSFAHHQ